MKNKNCRKNRGNSDRIREGSFTVEAACLMPVILFVLMAMIYLCFYVHNRAWLTAAANEAALDGAIEGVKRDGEAEETANRKGQERGNYGFYGAENLSMQVTGGSSIHVMYDLETIQEYGGISWHLSVEGYAWVLRPSEQVRKQKEGRK